MRRDDHFQNRWRRQPDLQQDFDHIRALRTQKEKNTKFRTRVANPANIDVECEDNDP